MWRVIVVITGLTLLVASARMAHAVNASSPLPLFNTANFPPDVHITNPYMPLTPGTTFNYAGSKDGAVQTEQFVVSHQTKKVLGVTCVVIYDTDAVTGTVVEVTQDWFTQDITGNVWYMGEYATQYHNGVVTGHQGSWEGGVAGAQPGIVMLAHPDVGDTYAQENWPGHAQDHATVLSVSQSVCVPYGCWYGHVLWTAEFSPLEPGVVEHKYYALGVGEVQSADVKGPGSEQMQLVSVRPGP